jgi:hypothetical protein
MSSTMIDSTATLAAISKLEADLAKLKIALGVENVTVPTKTRKSKVVKADGEKKAPNVWIRFTQKVNGALKEAGLGAGEAAPVSKQFASFLKDAKPYDEWTDESIVAAWATWEKPEQSKMAKAASESESEGGSVKKSRAKKAAKAASEASEASSTEGGAEGEKKERKKRAPMTDEAKAAMKAKRDATKAKKAAETGAAALPASTASSDSEDAVEAVAAPAAPAKSATFKPKKVVKSVPAFTIEQLQDFDAVEIDGAEFGRNVRGDMVDTDGAYVGHWDGTKIVKGEKPADWEKVQPSSA